jgi:hypothetical protein
VEKVLQEWETLNMVDLVSRRYSLLMDEAWYSRYPAAARKSAVCPVDVEISSAGYGWAWN